MVERGYTYYHDLGVEPSASAKDILDAYRRIMMQVHPDRSDSEYANEEAQIINEAYEALSDPARRSEYDRKLASKGISAVGASSGRRQRGNPFRRNRGRSSEQRKSRANIPIAISPAMRYILSWLLLTAFLGVIFGYIVGFRAARPVLQDWTGPVGLFAVGVLALLGVALLLRSFRGRRLAVDWFWMFLEFLWSLFGQLRAQGGDGTLKRNIVSLCSIAILGGAGGGILGYITGMQTAQFVFDMVAGLGLIAIVATVVGVGVYVVRRGNRY